MTDPKEALKVCYRWKIQHDKTVKDPAGQWLNVDDLVLVIAVVDTESRRFNPSFSRGMSYALEQLSKRLGIEPP